MEEWFTVVDHRGYSYQLHLLEYGSSWFAKVFDGNTSVGRISCLNQGDTLFLGDLYVLEAATRPIRGLAWVKVWFGFDMRGRTENYRNRGLGSALLTFAINRARAGGYRRVIGKLAAIDLKAMPGLPDWYRHRGFHVTMEADHLAGTLELTLS